jgi:hypothetical protein
MTTHQELLDQHGIIAKLTQLISTRARIAEVGSRPGRLPLPPRSARRLEILELWAHEQALIASLTEAHVLLNDPPAELERRQLAHNSALARLVSQLSPDVPLVLLPVRLETRFLRASDGISEDILIRIYPDDLHLDRHEPKLTADELEWGEVFWKAMTAANQNADAEKKERGRKEAWAQLATRFGTRRAAWLAHALTPGASRPDSREEEWNRAEEARCLPERWLVSGYRADNSRVFEKWTSLLPVRLETGPNPQVVPNAEGMTQGMRWMYDFEAAVQAGMAARVTLPKEEVESLRRLVVFGVKGTLDITASRQAFIDLLNAHHYTDGLALVPQGTPTNNTPATRAGRRDDEPLRDLLGEDAFAVEVNTVCSPIIPQDGAVLARALGV